MADFRFLQVETDSGAERFPERFAGGEKTGQGRCGAGAAGTDIFRFRLIFVVETQTKTANAIRMFMLQIQEVPLVLQQDSILQTKCLHGLMQKELNVSL